MPKIPTETALIELRELCRREHAHIAEVLAIDGPMTQQHRITIVGKSCNMIRELNKTLISEKT